MVALYADSNGKRCTGLLKFYDFNKKVRRPSDLRECISLCLIGFEKMVLIDEKGYNIDRYGLFFRTHEYG